jgi:hypothetical protein
MVRPVVMKTGGAKVVNVLEVLKKKRAAGG